MSAKAQNGVSPEIEQAINYAVAGAFAAAQKQQSVAANHTIGQFPATTTAISSTVETAIGSVSLTAKSTGKFRITVVGTFTPTNTTTGSVVTPQISWAIGTGAAFTASNTPGISMLPQIAASAGGQAYAWVYETNQQVATTSTVTPIGTAINVQLNAEASNIGAEALASALTLRVEEIF